MRGVAPALLILLSVLVVLPEAANAARQGEDCGDWQDCRGQAEQALAAASFERAHDLAWRAVQRGPANDPGLMFLLARAQCRSGRLDDALVMVRRLAERGVASDAAAHPDLERTRALPGWAAVEALLAGAAAPAAAAPSPEPAVSAAAPSLEASTRPASPMPAAAIHDAPGTALEPTELAEETVRVSSDRFVAAGLAYDAVSQRFVLGDRDGRKVRVVGDGLDEAVDLVRAESAGFSAIRALTIDTRRGDLWVASSDETGGAGTLHRLQLISGRPLKSYPIEDRLAAPVDIAVTPAGVVLLLDGTGRLARLRPGAAALEAPIDLGLGDATSLAAGEAENQAFVASRDGLARVNLQTGAATKLRAPDGVSLAGFLRLRVSRQGLVGLQSEDDGTARLVGLALAANARAVRAATRFGMRIAIAGGVRAFTVTGDDVALVGDPPAGDSIAGRDGAAPALVVRRVRLHPAGR